MRLACAVVLLAVIALPAVAAGESSASDQNIDASDPSADPLDVASGYFSAGRWEEAMAAFESAARNHSSLPARAFWQWGTAASEAGRPLAAYVRFRQCLALGGEAIDRESATAGAARAREALLAGGARFSRVFASLEQWPDGESPGERRLTRIAARDDHVSLEALIGPRIESPAWRRADEIRLAPYLDLIRQLLDGPIVTQEFPAQPLDPNAVGPRRAAVLRLVVGDEEWRAEALRGEPYERLADAVGVVVEFARRVPTLVIEGGKTPLPPPRTGKRNR